MLVSTEVYVTWNSRNKKHYENLGYKFTAMNEKFLVNVNDLTKGSQAVVDIECDYCHKIYQLMWYQYLKSRQTFIKKDACKDCYQQKAKESVAEKYGSFTDMYNSSNAKRIKTNLDKYGCENVFSNKDIQSKIVDTNLKKYGVKYNQQNVAVRNKTINTVLKKYGVKHYVEIFKGKYIKENSPRWKGGVDHSRVERATHEYDVWRKGVFERDHFICQKCGQKTNTLNAHHIKNWKDNADSRYDVSNGATLCEECHIEFHKKYGKSHNTKEQFIEFINTKDEKIC